jgi:hypothetical protein
MSVEREDALARSRAAALAELRAAPTTASWRAEAVRVVAGFAGTALLGAAAALATSLAGWPRVLERAPLLLGLLATAALAGFAILAPRGRPRPPGIKPALAFSLPAPR